MQKFRGPVGTGSGGTISTGFLKDYWYDDRLRYRSPPYFLNPLKSAWEVIQHPGAGPGALAGNPHRISKVPIRRFSLTRTSG